MAGPPELIGHAVRLRGWAEADLERLDAILAEPSVTRWWGPPVAGSAARAWVDEPVATTTTFVIEHQDRVVGSVQVSEETHPDYRHAGIDIFLATEAQDRGLGPDAIRTVARYLFEQRGHHRLTIDPAVANERAVRAYAKVGFRPVGVMRRYERGVDGSFHDGRLMDLLRDEMV